MAAELPTLRFATKASWQRWLGTHHASSAGIWMELAKIGSDVKSLSYAEAIEVAICYGWIDGQKAAADEQVWLQKFTPRRRRSRWSRINRDRAEALISVGLMAPAGMAEVERARRDGRWDAAYEGQATSEVPDDLAAALAANPGASDFFAALDSRNRYAILYRVQGAKKPETRARRIETFVEMLANRQKIHP